jgi:hypothetical protein
MTLRRAVGPGSASLQRAFASAHWAQRMGRGAGEAHRCVGNRQKHARALSVREEAR